MIQKTWRAIRAAFTPGPTPGNDGRRAVATGGVDVRTNAFELKLGGDWREYPSLEPEQFSFFSEAEQTAVVISVISIKLPRERLMDAANELDSGRREAEIAARPKGEVVFGDSWVELVDDGQVGHIAYAGYDSSNIFRFFGWTTEAKILTFWVSTKTRDNEASKRIFDEVFSGFSFSVP